MVRVEEWDEHTQPFPSHPFLGSLGQEVCDEQPRAVMNSNCTYDYFT